ncbi:MAG TPA: hypothetical protein VKU94_01315, partial [Geobacterales bacterium]|nr:hypothetical protein [Geobacterales bacterium]
MEIKINGVPIVKPLGIQFNEEVEKLNQLIDSNNRKLRRSKPFKKLAAFISLIIPLGTTSIAHAQSLSENPLEHITQEKGIIAQLANKFIPSPTDYVQNQVGLGEGIDRKNT